MAFKKASEYKIDRWEIQPGSSGGPSGVRAHVSGHPTGIFAAIANALGMGRSLDLRLTGEAVMLETSSLSHAGRTNIPLRSLSSISAGRTRPILLPAILCLMGLASFATALSGDDGGGSSNSFSSSESGGGGDSGVAIIFALVLIGAGIFLYIRGGRLEVVLSETGGDSLGFRFRPTAVSGVSVDEKAAFALCDLATALALGHDGAPTTVPAYGNGAGGTALGLDPAPGNDAVPGNGATPPGWYPDPGDPTGQRYWSGTEWTEQTTSA